jgi:hypothetical protein
MQCYFLRDGHVTDVVEMLPLGLSDEDAIAKARTLSAKRKGPDSFQIWDKARLVISSPGGGEHFIDLLRGEVAGDDLEPRAVPARPRRSGGLPSLARLCHP